MPTTRRRVLGASALGGAALAFGYPRASRAADEPIRIGWLPALTGSSSSTGIAMDRGVRFAVDEINAAGGVKGRKVELLTRDTQSDPTKAVNTSAELTRQARVHVLYGPGNSGEALACTPLIAKSKTLHIDPCWVDAVIDVEKYPLAFRSAPSNQQIGAASNRYVMDVLKIKDIAVIGDTTGYGTSSVDTYVPMLKAKGANIVYQGVSDSALPDMRPELLKMKAAGARVIMPWSVNAGFLARIINGRSQMGWDVPIAGQTTLGSGQTRALLEKPEYWENVFQINFRSTSYDTHGALPPRSAEFVKRLKAANVDLSDTLLWWVAVGYDVPTFIAAAVAQVGSETEAMSHWLETQPEVPGIFADYKWTAKQHNGYPDDYVVMSQANSFRDGTFKLAPGYSAS